MLRRSWTLSSARPALWGYGLVVVAAVGAPLATIRRGSVVDTAVALAFSLGAALLTVRLPKRPASAVLGAVAAVGGVLLLTQARHGATSWILAAMVGAGVGLAAPMPASPDRVARLSPAIALVAAVAVTGAWIGANSPSATWFGSMISHGPRSGNEVAITFDDGPDVPSTLQISDILDSHGVKATFFSVGKALDARPDVSAALLADGNLLGNHSYRHDERGWLDPRYPELGMTQRAFDTRLGVCPTFYRPPHGQHTPLMAWEVHRAGMRMVGWDVSAGDWATHDPAVITRRVLAGVRPGSIIDLHDGLDGKVYADRSVLVAALPAILDGLAARGLHAVTLDRLLGVAPYAGRCS